MSEARFDVIVCGSLHLDIIVKGAPLPKIDETAVGSEWNMECGGKGGNQAVMASRMGARTAMIGRVGLDEFGQRLLSNLDRFRVGRTAVLEDGSACSGMSVAILDTRGDYGAVIVSGANLFLDPHACARDWDMLGGGKALVLQNEVPESVNAAVARAAKAAGAAVFLNAAPARAPAAELLDLIDVLVVNRIEAEAMSGVEVKDAETAKLALPALGGGSRNIVITLGSEGLVLQGKADGPHFIAPHKVKAVSSHGAGDCFVGALAAQMANGATLADACAVASRAAAALVSMSEQERASFDFTAL